MTSPTAVVPRNVLQHENLDRIRKTKYCLLLTYGNLDPLRGKALAEIRTLYHTRELLGRMDLKDLAEAGGEHWRGGSVESLHGAGGADVDEVHFQSVSDDIQLIGASMLRIEHKPE